MAIIPRLLVMAAVAFAMLAATASDASAQADAGPRIDIELPTATSSMSVRLRNSIDGGRFEELLRNGFDVRVHMRAELWRMGGFFNNLVARQEWDLIIHYDQFDQTFEVARLDADMNVSPLGTYRRLDDAKSALALPFSPPIGRPGPGADHYYSVQADISTLDLNDLDEVTRWLRGELAPAVQGRRNPGTALTRGVRTLLSRLMGGEVRRLEARSPRFRVTAPDQTDP